MISIIKKPTGICPICDIPLHYEKGKIEVRHCGTDYTISARMLTCKECNYQKLLLGNAKIIAEQSEDELANFCLGDESPEFELAKQTAQPFMNMPADERRSYDISENESAQVHMGHESQSEQDNSAHLHTKGHETANIEIEKSVIGCSESSNAATKETDKEEEAALNASHLIQEHNSVPDSAAKEEMNQPSTAEHPMAAVTDPPQEPSLPEDSETLHPQKSSLEKPKAVHTSVNADFTEDTGKAQPTKKSVSSKNRETPDQTDKKASPILQKESDKRSAASSQPDINTQPPEQELLAAIETGTKSQVALSSKSSIKPAANPVANRTINKKSANERAPFGIRNKSDPFNNYASGIKDNIRAAASICAKSAQPDAAPQTQHKPSQRKVNVAIEKGEQAASTSYVGPSSVKGKNDPKKEEEKDQPDKPDHIQEREKKIKTASLQNKRANSNQNTKPEESSEKSKNDSAGTGSLIKEENNLNVKTSAKQPTDNPESPEKTPASFVESNENNSDKRISPDSEEKTKESSFSDSHTNIRDEKSSQNDDAQIPQDEESDLSENQQSEAGQFEETIQKLTENIPEQIVEKIPFLSTARKNRENYTDIKNEKKFLKEYVPHKKVIINDMIYDTDESEMFLIQKGAYGFDKPCMHYNYRTKNGRFFRITVKYKQDDLLRPLDETEVKRMLETNPEQYKKYFPNTVTEA